MPISIEIFDTGLNLKEQIDYSPSSHLSYVLGVLLGDGCVCINKTKSRYVIVLEVRGDIK